MKNTNDPFIVRINKNKSSRIGNGSIYHEIIMNNGKRIYVDPENYNYKSKWSMFIEYDRESIGARLVGLRLKNDHCYDADVFPSGCYFDDQDDLDDDSPFNNLFE